MSRSISFKPADISKGLIINLTEDEYDNLDGYEIHTTVPVYNLYLDSMNKIGDSITQLTNKFEVANGNVILSINNRVPIENYILLYFEVNKELEGILTFTPITKE